MVPVVSYMAMNFTGSSTFTCQPGATMEVRRSLVPLIACLVLGVGLTAVTRVLSV